MAINPLSAFQGLLAEDQARQIQGQQANVGLQQASDQRSIQGLALIQKLIEIKKMQRQDQLLAQAFQGGAQGGQPLNLEAVGIAMLAGGIPEGGPLLTQGRLSRTQAAVAQNRARTLDLMAKRESRIARENTDRAAALVERPRLVSGVDPVTGNQTVTFVRPSGGKTQILPTKPTSTLTLGKNAALFGKTLNRDFERDPSVELFRKFEPRLQRVADYVKALPQEGENSADDFALTRLFLSMTSGKGREFTRQEMQQIGSFASFPAIIKEGISRVAFGKTLSGGVRSEMFNVINGQFKTLDTAIKRKALDVTERGRVAGVSRGNIFGPSEAARLGLPEGE